MKKDIIRLLEQNARYSNDELAVMLNATPQLVASTIAQLENDGVIKGYTTVFDHEKIDANYVEAIIELKVTPKRDYGFDQIAQEVAEFDEVVDLYLMSGTYDLCLIVRGNSFKDIALFVSQRLSPLDSVVSTATHFMLSRYKEKGIVSTNSNDDERGVLSLC